MNLSQPPIFAPSNEVTVRFQDCDPFGHLNNARYIDYFMNAREDHLRDAYGFYLFDHSQQHNESWVVTKSQIAYLFPARVAEVVTITTRLINHSEQALTVEGVMLDKDGGRVKAVLWFDLAYISLASGRPVRHTPPLMEMFHTLRDRAVEYVVSGFDERVEALKQFYRQQRKQPATTQ
jgi:acyl-CoA thioester hydrolase